MSRNGNNYSNNGDVFFDENSLNRNRESRENLFRIPNHNHEFITSTDYAESDECVIHNHRTAGLTGPAIRSGNSHVHRVEAFTDTFDDHAHKICDTTGPAIWLINGKHIHLVKGETGRADGNNHDHDYFFTTQIQDPSNVPENRTC